MEKLLEITRTIICDTNASDPVFDELLSKRLDAAEKAAKETGLYWHILTDITWVAVSINHDVTPEQVLEALKVLGWNGGEKA